FVTYPLATSKSSRVNLVGGAGYTYRTGGFSSAIPWTVVADYSPTRFGFGGVLGFHGITSLKTDSNSATTSPSSTAASIGTGGSFITNAVNPSLVTLEAQLNYRLENQMRVSLSGYQALFGSSAPKGFYVTAGLQIYIGGRVDGEENEEAPANRMNEAVPQSTQE